MYLQTVRVSAGVISRNISQAREDGVHGVEYSGGVGQLGDVGIKP